MPELVSAKGGYGSISEYFRELVRVDRRLERELKIDEDTEYQSHRTYGSKPN